MKQSLQMGRLAEGWVKQQLEFAGIEVEFNENVNERELYDLSCVVSKKKFTIEVKYDVMAQKTGNIAIEYYNSKSCKPSGIHATKSDIWAHVLQDGTHPTIWLCKTNELRSFIANNKPWRNLTSVGDDNACIFLFKEDVILSIFSRVDDLDKDKVLKTVKRLLK